MSNAVRQLQHLVLDEACVDCYDLYQTEKKNNGTGGYCGTAIERQLAELVYQKRSEKLLADENCFKIFIVSFQFWIFPRFSTLFTFWIDSWFSWPSRAFFRWFTFYILTYFSYFLQYHQSGKMSIELLDTESEGQDTEEESSRKYSSYVDRFINPGEDLSEECRDHLTRKPVFLPRSIRSYNNSPYGKMRDEKGNTKKHENGNNDNEDSSENEKSSAKKELFGDKDSVFHEDNLQCKFNPRNFKILYVINSENCFYRRLALTRAKNVSWHSGTTLYHNKNYPKDLISQFIHFYNFLYSLTKQCQDVNKEISANGTPNGWKVTLPNLLKPASTNGSWANVMALWPTKLTKWPKLISNPPHIGHSTNTRLKSSRPRQWCQPMVRQVPIQQPIQMTKVLRKIEILTMNKALWSVIHYTWLTGDV